MRKLIFFLMTVITPIIGCSTTDETTPIIPEPTVRNLNYLALGDSYTIGQNVCETCRFPEQLKDSLMNYLPSTDNIFVKVVAQTG